jgi:hypothetical protein
MRPETKEKEGGLDEPALSNLSSSFMSPGNAQPCRVIRSIRQNRYCMPVEAPTMVVPVQQWGDEV